MGNKKERISFVMEKCACEKDVFGRTKEKDIYAKKKQEIKRREVTMFVSAQN